MLCRPFALGAVTLTLLLSFGASAASAGTVGVTHAMTKVRPSSAVPTTTSVSLDAAQNEFEPFQIVVGGSATKVSATATALTGPSGAVIPASEVVLYRQGLYQIGVASNSEGATGPWPDPLIPDVDAYAGEKRNAFPFDVPSGEVRAIWVEVFVPRGTPAGTYHGQVNVTGTGLAATAVPITLRVRGFELPSTSSLRTAFGMGWDDPCTAHHGSYAACGSDAGIEKYHVLYGEAALDHRISLDTLVYWFGDAGHFDATYGPLLEGTGSTRLEGARQTTVRVSGSNYSTWRDHFKAKGYTARVFDYTCDEPPNGCAWSSISSKASSVQAGGVSTLVTTDLSAATSKGLLSSIDILVPIVQSLHDKGGVSIRQSYDQFLAMSPKKELWWYQSCISHGCGQGCSPTTGSYYTGWPSYVIDASAIQNRAMEWLSFNYDITGELYFQTTHLLDTAWTNQCDFSGNGDGTLFYPGKPSIIGGTTDIPIESIRLKLIREGMEDYEYLKLLADLGDSNKAHALASAAFPTPYMVAATDPSTLYSVRAQLADRIEQLIGVTPPVCVPTTCAKAGATCGSISNGCGGTLSCGSCTGSESCGLLTANRCDAPAVPPPAAPDIPDGDLIIGHATTAITVDGDLAEFAGIEPVTVRANDADAKFYMLWDADHLYFAADVTDRDLYAWSTGDDANLRNADSVELLLDPLRTAQYWPDGDDRHVIVSALGHLRDARGAGWTEDISLDMGISRAVTVNGTVGDKGTDRGYTVELAIPWAGIGVEPTSGLVMGGNLATNDARSSGWSRWAAWTGNSGYTRPSSWKTLVLGAAPTTAPVCLPLSCADRGAACGSVEDGCGGVVNCGDCADGEICGLSTANACNRPTRPFEAVRRAGGPVTINGDLSEFAAAPSIALKTPSATANVRLLWDSDALYVSASVLDSDLHTPGTGNDGELWFADGIEAMLDPLWTASAQPDADDRHVIVSARGDVLDAQGTGANENRAISMGIARAVVRFGILDDAASDIGYNLEFSIPWTSLGIAPDAGRLFGADFALNDATATTVETSDWAGLASYAQPSAWGIIQLSPFVSGSNGASSLLLASEGFDTGDEGTDGATDDGSTDLGAGASPAPGMATAGPGPTGCGGAGDPWGGAVPVAAALLGLAVLRRRQRAHVAPQQR